MEEVSDDDTNKDNDLSNQSGMPAKRQIPTFIKRQQTMLDKIPEEVKGDIKESRYMLQVIQKNKNTLNIQQ